jgi:hypothetical protein
MMTAKEKKAAYMKEYRQRPKTKARAKELNNLPEKLEKRRTPEFKAKKKAYNKAYNQTSEFKADRKSRVLTVNGRIGKTYDAMTSRVRGKHKARAHIYEGLSICSREEFMEWAKNDDEFNKRFEDWLESGQQLSMSPSIDRINPEKGYDLDNMQWLTVSENTAKAHEDKARKI